MHSATALIMPHSHRPIKYTTTERNVTPIIKQWCGASHFILHFCSSPSVHCTLVHLRHNLHVNFCMPATVTIETLLCCNKYCCTHKYFLPVNHNSSSNCTRRCSKVILHIVPFYVHLEEDTVFISYILNSCLKSNIICFSWIAEDYF